MVRASTPGQRLPSHSGSSVSCITVLLNPKFARVFPAKLAQTGPPSRTPPPEEKKRVQSRSATPTLRRQTAPQRKDPGRCCNLSPWQRREFHRGKVRWQSPRTPRNNQSRKMPQAARAQVARTRFATFRKSAPAPRRSSDRGSKVYAAQTRPKKIQTARSPAIFRSKAPEKMSLFLRG